MTTYVYHIRKTDGTEKDITIQAASKAQLDNEFRRRPWIASTLWLVSIDGVPAPSVKRNCEEAK
jgi:hypothetical protein